ncbi:hypothetical protein [Streptomyces avidinii]|uniref:Lantibiotic biosynthesis dehydratase-like protein n=1 Tax=Streptomyces avidinii TaxID=1895 RepID=A0ABS4L4E0_STRAV|nr:hypothetical protein [Streptomyces avidinii]MBP2036979.1 hypothetical protein [Streptomyces avidinii]GGY94357.1 hypothetical protein GCM10010343_19540 [Streptomyces avidinii]
MLTRTVHEDSRLSLWLRVRRYAVPPSMIETATVRRSAGDWAGACAAAGVDVDFDLRFLARSRGHDLTARIRADLRHLAPDLLRWHMPRIAPDGLLRPGLTVPLARYDTGEPYDADVRDGTAVRDDPRTRPVYLVARTPPAWADGGQRISLALWDGSRPADGSWGDPRRGARPDRQFRLDLHRHLWDARRAGELGVRSGAGRRPADCSPAPDPEPLAALPQGHRCAVDRWAAETAILLRAEGRASGTVTVRPGAGRRLLLDLVADGPGPPVLRAAAAPAGRAAALPVLPDAAVWTLPDLELVRTGSIEVERLHPLVASALATGRAPDRAPGGPPGTADRAGEPRLVECRGARHRIGLVDGVLAALDHDPAEIRREELLAALTGTPLPCLQAIDTAHRRPDCLTGVRERLDHGDIAGALAVVEGLLGPGALLRAGALRDELEAAAQRRITYGLFRSGLAGPGPGRIRPGELRPRGHRPHPRQAHAR